MPSVAVPGGTLEYSATDLVPPWIGEAETVVFHHGLGACADIWLGWLPALIDRYRVLRFDMRGHGASGRPASEPRLDLDRLTDDLFAVMDAAGLRRAHLVGESIAGTVVLNAALRAPERVVTLTVSNGAHVGASIQSVQGWKEIIDAHGMAGWSAHMMGRRFFAGTISDAAWRWYESQQARVDPDSLLQGIAALVAGDLTPRLGGIAAPVLLLHADSSPFIPVSVMADLKDRLRNARLHVIGRARHGLPFSHAKECAALLRTFLDGARGG